MWVVKYHELNISLNKWILVLEIFFRSHLCQFIRVVHDDMPIAAEVNSTKYEVCNLHNLSGIKLLSLGLVSFKHSIFWKSWNGCEYTEKKINLKNFQTKSVNDMNKRAYWEWKDKQRKSALSFVLSARQGGDFIKWSWLIPYLQPASWSMCLVSQVLHLNLSLCTSQFNLIALSFLTD